MDIMNHHYRIIAPEGPINGRIMLPASKSISNRALIINALSYSPFKVGNLSDSDDTKVMESILYSNEAVFNVGHAGTAMRFLTAFLSKIAGEWVLTGSDRMQQRPIRILVEALRQLGAGIEYLGKEGYPPLKIYGTHLKGGILELDGSISSQYISALLMIAPTLDGGLTLRLKNKVASQSYIQMTLKLMELYGIQSSWKYNEIKIDEQHYLPFEFNVEADWSAAGYWYQILALAPAGEIELEGIRLSGIQGDQALSAWFNGFGIETIPSDKGVILSKKEDMAPIRIFLNLHENPDLAQTLAALCVARRIPFHFTGLETLKIKETNRIAALQAELAKFGAMLAEPAVGELQWDGEISLDGIRDEPIIDTYDDHRMALAFAPVSMAGYQVIIKNPGVVTKSYPGFWKDLRTAGFTLEEVSKD